MFQFYRIDNLITHLIVLLYHRRKFFKKLSKLNPSKAAGPDGLHCKLLYELRDILYEPLAGFFNRSLKEGVVPDQWRQAHVSPIFKKGGKKKVENYRRVSLTCVVCKVLESIV